QKQKQENFLTTIATIGRWTIGIVTDAAVSFAIYKGIQLGLGSLDPERKTNLPESLGFSVAVSTFVFQEVFRGVAKVGFKEWVLGTATKGVTKEILGKALLGGGVAAVGIFLISFLATYRANDEIIASFECKPWQADTGGKNCEKCNKQGILPCSEYQCRSLGQGCQLLNDEETGEAVCVWVNRGDTEYPIIEPWDGALISEDYEYKPNNRISPPDRGVLISYNNEKATSFKTIDGEKIGCAPAFTPLSFGVKLNEPGICKIDSTRKENFDEMNLYMGGSSTFKYNHLQIATFPGRQTDEQGIPIESGEEEQEFYVRCQDANGNSNPATFVFKFCIDKGPDETPPVIVTTDLLNNMPIAFGQSSININLYVNEPAECRWSHNDQPYENMENEMDCSHADDITDVNAQGLYTCNTKLTQIKDGAKNRFYFRCKDQPKAKEEDRNVNEESYEFTIRGTQPLVIDSASPNGTTVRDSTANVKVTLKAETSAGYNQGEATCYYSETGNANDYSIFFNTGSYTHSHDLSLTEGNYRYFIKCIDLGGNADTKQINFNVETDTQPPLVIRAYHEDTYLKVITNEPARCVYDVVNCNYPFDDGIKITTIDDINHFTDWTTDRGFYIKCKDKYGKQPNPNECTIIVRPSQV
ncbi:hypothetical protein DRN69_05605, partial [Candidatus Pacearchaeota archaeon]